MSHPKRVASGSPVRDAIQASKKQPLSTLLYALGIRHVGAQVARLLARHFGTMKALRNASVEEISKIRGVGMAIAEAVAGFFDEPKNRKLLERLEKLGLNFTEPTAEGNSIQPEARTSAHDSTK